MPVARHLAGGFDALRRIAGLLLALAWLIGQTVRDRHPALLWFYFIPALLPALFLPAWLAWNRDLSAPTRLAVALVAALAWARILLLDVAWHSPPPAQPGEIRLVHWNIARGAGGLARAGRTLARDDADLYVLSEFPRPVDAVAWSRATLDRPFAYADQSMALISRFPFDLTGTMPLEGGRCWTARVHAPRGLLDVWLVDLQSHPLLDRHRPCAQLAARVAARPGTVPLLIVGDFNTPRDASSLDPLRARLRLAADAAGRGWPYSWPLPLPVYALDHAWATPDLDLLAHRYAAAPASDHLRQIVRLRR